MSLQIAGRDVSRETFDRLIHFRDLVTKWTRKINLIAPATLPHIWERHIVDSAQTYHFAPESFSRWVDIGSGGGFPGIVMAIYAKEHQKAAHFTLIESDQRKATFLRTASRELDLHATILTERIEVATPQRADVVSARALAPLSALLPMAERHITPNGTALFPKGKSVAEEIADARQSWSFDLEQYPSFTDPAARLLVIQRISSAGA